MTTWLTRIVHESNGRPFTPDEVSRIGQYVEFLPDALTVVKKLDENQKWLIRHLSEWMVTKADVWGLPKDPFVNDFAAFLAAVGHAVLANDVTLLDGSVVEPCVSLANALELPPEEFAPLFEETWRVLSPRLEPATATRLKPYFDYATDRLKDSAAPVRAADETESIEFPVFSEV